MTNDLSDDELALLRSVCARPDDDTPRLVYADWLDDQGDRLLALHAAFIREQVRWAREKETFTDAEYVESGRLQHRLLLSVTFWEGSDWCAGNALSMRLMSRGYAGQGYTRPERWDRGFPDVVKLRSVKTWCHATGRTRTGQQLPGAWRLYDRVPVRVTDVNGRLPLLPAREGDGRRWTRSGVYGEVSHPSELPSWVYDQLGGQNGFPNVSSAFVAAEKAFTDAGRVACGLAPRFKATPVQREGAA